MNGTSALPIDTAMTRPRALNEPVTWRSSSFSMTLASPGSGAFIWSAAITGVFLTHPSMRRRAASTSAMSIIICLFFFSQSGAS